MIRWYGVMYVLAFWIAWAVLPVLGKKRGLHLTRDQWTSSIIAWGALGVLIGGRLGYVLLYDPQYFFEYPSEIFKIWHGGMSFHGGFIGAAVGVWFAVRNFSPSYEGEKEGVRSRVGLLALADVIAIPAAIGLALGRIGNLTNGEFGMYPYYEAAWDVIIAGVCYVLLLYSSRVSLLPNWGEGEDEGNPQRNAALTPTLYKHGKVFASFLVLYSIGRFLLEYLRPQEWSYIYSLTRGQAYTIPILIAGVILWRYADKQ